MVYTDQQVSYEKLSVHIAQIIKEHMSSWVSEDILHEGWILRLNHLFQYEFQVFCPPKTKTHLIEHLEYLIVLIDYSVCEWEYLLFQSTHIIEVISSRLHC